MEIRSTDRICINGLTGTGKTVLMKWLASQVEPDLLIIDPLNQYGSFPDECRYIPKRETPQELETICQGLFSRSNMTLVVEEAEQYLQQARPLLPYTSGLIRMGRNWGIGIWATTRRIQDINKRFFDLAQHCFFYRCGLQSRDYIANMIGAEYVYPYAAPKYNKTGYCLTTLPEFHALHYNLTDETAEIITLELGAREHIKTIGKVSDAPLKTERKAEAPPEEALTKTPPKTEESQSGPKTKG